MNQESWCRILWRTCRKLSFDDSSQTFWPFVPFGKQSFSGAGRGGGGGRVGRGEAELPQTAAALWKKHTADLRAGNISQHQSKLLFSFIFSSRHRAELHFASFTHLYMYVCIHPSRTCPACRHQPPQSHPLHVHHTAKKQHKERHLP